MSQLGGEEGVSLRFLGGGEMVEEGGGLWYYSFVPRSLGWRWVGLGELMLSSGLAVSYKSRKGGENCHACYPALDTVWNSLALVWTVGYCCGSHF